MTTDTPSNKPSSNPVKNKLSQMKEATKARIKKSAQIAGILGVAYLWAEGFYEYRMEKSVNRVATKSMLSKVLEDNSPAEGHGLIIYYNPKTRNYDALHYPVDKDEVTLPSLMVTSATFKDQKNNRTFEMYEIVQKPEWQTEQIKLEAPLFKFHNEWSAGNYTITGMDGTKYTIVAINTGEKWPGAKNKFLFPNESEANSDYSILGKWLDTTKQVVNTTRVQKIVGSASEMVAASTNNAEENLDYENSIPEEEIHQDAPKTKPNISE